MRIRREGLKNTIEKILKRDCYDIDEIIRDASEMITELFIHNDVYVRNFRKMIISEIKENEELEVEDK